MKWKIISTFTWQKVTRNMIIGFSKRTLRARFRGAVEEFGVAKYAKSFAQKAWTFSWSDGSWSFKRKARNDNIIPGGFASRHGRKQRLRGVHYPTLKCYLDREATKTAWRHRDIILRGGYYSCYFSTWWCLGHNCLSKSLQHEEDSNTWRNFN